MPNELDNNSPPKLLRQDVTQNHYENQKYLHLRERDTRQMIIEIKLFYGHSMKTHEIFQLGNKFNT